MHTRPRVGGVRNLAEKTKADEKGSYGFEGKTRSESGICRVRDFTAPNVGDGPFLLVRCRSYFLSYASQVFAKQQLRTNTKFVTDAAPRVHYELWRVL